MLLHNGLGLNNFNSWSYQQFKVSCTIKLERLVYNIVQVKLSSQLFSSFIFSDYSQLNRYIPSSTLGIDNHLALAIDVTISSIY